MHRGFFITFEGSEACGKSTQIQLLADRLKELNFRVALTREPGGTPIGEEIRHLLQFSQSNAAMTPEAELLLFTASRAQLVRELILPSLRRGVTVIADRFFDSTTVYQGVARAIEPSKVKLINEFAVGECRPDLTFVLDLDCEIAHTRLADRAKAGAAKDRMEQEPPAFYQAVRRGYLELAEQEADRVKVIDASGSIQEVHHLVWNQIESLLQVSSR